jgi:hypothetical protein
VATGAEVCTVTFYLPGLSKQEVRLTQRLANRELLVESCGQRRIVEVPPGFGKVTAAKFENHCLTVTLGVSAAS